MTLEMLSIDKIRLATTPLTMKQIKSNKGQRKTLTKPILKQKGTQGVPT